MANSDESQPQAVPPRTVRYSVVIPVYNEAACIEELNRRLVDVMTGLNESYEIIYVNDGSSDGTFELLESFVAENRSVRALHFTRNFGQHPAVYAGFDHYQGEVIITLDADLQNPPEEIPRLIGYLGDNVDMVAGVRSERHDSVFRTLPSRFVNWMIGKLTRVPLRDYGCLLRVYRRSVIEMLRRCQEHSVYFTAMISWLGVRIVEIEVHHAPRAAGSSKYNWLKLITMNFDLITGYSIFPIQLISLGGLAVAGLGFVFGVGFLLASLFSPATGSYVGLGFSVAFLMFGVLLVALGFIGEYIGRILIEVKGRPFYLLRDELIPSKSEARVLEKSPGEAKPSDPTGATTQRFENTR